MLNISAEHKKEHLYLEVYHYYRKLILEGRLLPGSKMPSLRKCAQELKLSRTTIENAYLLLAADGYIIAKAQSGYYVTGIASKQHLLTPEKQDKDITPCLYDFASSGVDRESFRFDLWQRYIKSALRQGDRMLSYDDIVVGAGLQPLLQILCPLIHERKTVSFPTPSFTTCSTIFQDYGFDVHYRDKSCDVIYVSPAHMTKWGEIMPVKRRLELIRHAEINDHLIIEDDFENEFVYFQKPTPSLFGLAGGENVVYIGSFSRLLLPSIRVSFMVLPRSLREKYTKKAAFYNQTASKTEQIALCQFIRDGHLASQTRKLRRLYSQKLKALSQAVRETFGQDCQIQTGAAGTSLALTLPCSLTGSELTDRARNRGLGLEVLRENGAEVTLVLSCSSIPSKDFLPACQLLKEVTGS